MSHYWSILNQIPVLLCHLNRYNKYYFGFKQCSWCVTILPYIQQYSNVDCTCSWNSTIRPTVCNWYCNDGRKLVSSMQIACQWQLVRYFSHFKYNWIEIVYFMCYDPALKQYTMICSCCTYRYFLCTEINDTQHPPKWKTLNYYVI